MYVFEIFQGRTPDPPSEVGSLRSVAPRLALQNFSLGCRPPHFRIRIYALECL